MISKHKSTYNKEETIMNSIHLINIPIFYFLVTFAIRITNLIMHAH